jgi:hypothetical protein
MNIQITNYILSLVIILVSAACSNQQESLEGKTGSVASEQKMLIEKTADTTIAPMSRQALFGDLHVHTSWSLDGYIIFNRTTPRDAYHFARGGEIDFYQNPRKLAIPLDFTAVTEHAEFLGESILCSDPESDVYSTDMCTDMRNEKEDPEVEHRTFVNILLKVFKADRPVRPAEICGDDGLRCMDAGRKRWQAIQNVADEFYVPGEFTTLIGYEWTGQQGGNRHRNVIFRNNTVPATAWSMIEVSTVEELWQKLDDECLPPCEVLTISHNSNQSKGTRFNGMNPDGSPFSKEQAAYRASHEPLVEVMQFKGNSECRLGFGTEDEFCSFENYDLRPSCPLEAAPGSSLKCVVPCDENGKPEGCIWSRNYVRNALKMGLAIEEQVGANPYLLGLLGSTDTHNSNPGNTTEENYQGNFGFLDAKAEDRLRLKLETGFKLLPRNSGALAAVWSEENTRESIFDALQRRETFGTSGTRLVLRFFGGWDFPSVLDKDIDLATLGYSQGVSMGARLPIMPDDGAPRFLFQAAKAVDGRKLQRVQVVKGWMDSGQSKEEVYDVLCANGQAPTSKDGRCSANTATVNISDCSVQEHDGANELNGMWQDPDFDPTQRAFYYLRVLENPTCRWSTYEANRLGREAPVDAPPIIQERAWSSPIWYSPTL